MHGKEKKYENKILTMPMKETEILNVHICAICRYQKKLNSRFLWKKPRSWTPTKAQYRNSTTNAHDFDERNRDLAGAVGTLPLPLRNLLEHVSDRARNDTLLLLKHCAHAGTTHGVCLSRPCLAVRQHRGVVAVEAALHKLRNAVLVDVFLHDVVVVHHVVGEVLAAEPELVEGHFLDAFRLLVDLFSGRERPWLQSWWQCTSTSSRHTHTWYNSLAERGLDCSHDVVPKLLKGTHGIMRNINPVRMILMAFSTRIIGTIIKAAVEFLAACIDVMLCGHPIKIMR